MGHASPCSAAVRFVTLPFVLPSSHPAQTNSELTFSVDFENTSAIGTSRNLDFKGTGKLTRVRQFWVEQKKVSEGSRFGWPVCAEETGRAEGL